MTKGINLRCMLVGGLSIPCTEKGIGMRCQAAACLEMSLTGM